MIADKTGVMCIYNLPLLILFAGRNNILISGASDVRHPHLEVGLTLDAFSHWHSIFDFQPFRRSLESWSSFTGILADFTACHSTE